MPKRRHSDEDSEDSDYLRRKMKKYEKKLEKRQRKKRSRNRSESISPQLYEHGDEMEIRSEVNVIDTSLGPSTSTAATEAQPTASDTEATQMDPSVLPVETVQDTPQLDEDILDLLGETPSKDKKYGPEIRGELAVRLAHIATQGLSKEDRKELLDCHLVPKNCTFIDAPKLNLEIKAALSDMLIKKDKALEYKQFQLAASISCISEALTRMFTLEHKDQMVIKLLITASRLLCDSQHKESMTRRNFICSSIKREIKDQLLDTDIDEFLFGEKLADTLRSAKAISKSGADIKIPPAKKNTPFNQQRQAGSQSLNQRPPLPASRQAGAQRRYAPTTSTAHPPPRHQQQQQQQRAQKQLPRRWQPPPPPRR